MSVLDNQTKVNPTTAFYATGGGGGGGGGGPTPTVSTITTSSIIALSNVPVNVGPAGLYVYTNGFGDENSGFEVYKGGGNTTNALADFDSGAGGQGAMGVRGFSTIGGAQVIDTLFTMTLDPSRNGVIKLQQEFAGVSTMSGITLGNDGSITIAALPPASGGSGTGLYFSPYGASIETKPQGSILTHSAASTIGAGNFYVPAAGTTQTLAAIPTTPGALYDIRVNARFDTVGGNPSAGDWCVLTTDAANAKAIDTIDCAQVSTLQQQFERSYTASFVASAGTTNLIALGRPTATASTAITIQNPAVVWFRSLGVPL